MIVLARIKQFEARHPQWWAWLLSACAWLGMAPHMFPGLFAGSHAHHHHAAQSLTREWLGWMGMVIAMMLPFLVWQIRRVAMGTFRYRRHLAIACLITGFLATWGLAGLLLAPLTMLKTFHSNTVVAILLLGSAIWYFTPWYRQALYRHHSSRPLPPAGWTAVSRTIVEGARLGLACVIGCGPLMVACLASRHSAVVMSGGFVLTWIERNAFEPHPKKQAAWCLCLAMASIGVAWLG